MEPEFFMVGIDDLIARVDEHRPSCWDSPSSPRKDLEVIWKAECGTEGANIGIATTIPLAGVEMTSVTTKKSVILIETTFFFVLPHMIPGAKKNASIPKLQQSLRERQRWLSSHLKRRGRSPLHCKKFDFQWQ